MSTQPPSPRKRGAQPGNRNALKHGFYSRLFTTADKSRLDQISEGDLSSEIKLLRVSIYRLASHILKSTDHQELVAGLATVSSACIRLARLILINDAATNEEDEFWSGVKNYWLELLKKANTSPADASQIVGDEGEEDEDTDQDPFFLEEPHKEHNGRMIS